VSDDIDPIPVEPARETVKSIDTEVDRCARRAVIVERTSHFLPAAANVVGQRCPHVFEDGADVVLGDRFMQSQGAVLGNRLTP